MATSLAKRLIRFTITALFVQPTHLGMHPSGTLHQVSVLLRIETHAHNVTGHDTPATPTIDDRSHLPTVSSSSGETGTKIRTGSTAQYSKHTGC